MINKQPASPLFLYKVSELHFFYCHFLYLVIILLEMCSRLYYECLKPFGYVLSDPEEDKKTLGDNIKEWWQKKKW